MRNSITGQNGGQMTGTCPQRTFFVGRRRGASDGAASLPPGRAVHWRPKMKTRITGRPHGWAGIPSRWTGLKPLVRPL